MLRSERPKDKGALISVTYEVWVNATIMIYLGENRTDAYALFTEQIVKRHVARALLKIKAQYMFANEFREVQWDCDKFDLAGSFGVTSDQMLKAREDAEAKRNESK